MLKELYHGDLAPSDRKADPNDKILQEWRKLSTEFEKSLTQEQIKTYHRLSDMQGESAAKDNEALYIQGFKDGALLMMMFLKYFTQQYGKESVSLAETLEEKYAKLSCVNCLSGTMNIILFLSS